MKPPAPTGSSRKRSTSWWLISLAAHGVLLGLLFLIFPYQEFVKPKAREKIRQPLVNRKTLDATTKRIEEKQAEEMARKLREIIALKADIQAVEVRQSASHNAFVSTITQISPELAGGLAGMAREQLDAYLALQKSEEETWTAFSDNDSVPKLSDPELKNWINKADEQAKAIASAQDKLNFAQAGLLETQRQIAGRLGFLKSEQPELVEQQAALVAAWGATMSLGSTYTAGFSPLEKMLSDADRKFGEFTRSHPQLAQRQKDLAAIEGTIAKRSQKITTDEAAIEAKIAEQNRLDPADKKKLQNLVRQIDGMKKELARTKGQQTSDETKKQGKQKSVQAAEAEVQMRTKALTDLLDAIPPARKTLTESRKPYLTEMRRVMDLQKSLDAKMTATLALPAASAPLPSEPAPTQ